MIEHKEHCTELVDFLRVEKSIILKHIERHMYFQHIDDFNHAIADFNDKYGWLMRELFCGYMCLKRHNCEIAKQFIPENQSTQNQ